MKKTKIIAIMAVLVILVGIFGGISASASTPMAPASVTEEDLQYTYAVVADNGENKDVLTVTYDEKTANNLAQELGENCWVEKLDIKFNSNALESAQNELNKA